MKTRDTVFVKLNGRIGNHLFQVATVASLAHRHNADFGAICHDEYILAEPDNCSILDYIQQFRDNIFRRVPIYYNVHEHNNLFHEIPGIYSDIPFSNGLCLVGSFQSERYFDEDVVRELFRIPESLRRRLLSKYGHILINDVTSINVRRGDYLNRPHEYNITSMRFFRDAIDYIGRNNTYMIISDDIAWCRRHFKGGNYHFAENSKPLEDLYLQSMCKNNIISNSTFSWWGAWLNDCREKIVIAPRPWYGPALSHISTANLIPRTWVQIDNCMDLALRLKAQKILSTQRLRAALRRFRGR